jgi:hypothetical protein
MQQRNQTISDFSARTDALATALKVTLRELGPKIEISPAMLFAYRSGANEISAKAWHKLWRAEVAAGLAKSEQGLVAFTPQGGVNYGATLYNMADQDRAMLIKRANEILADETLSLSTRVAQGAQIIALLEDAREKNKK